MALEYDINGIPQTMEALNVDPEQRATLASVRRDIADKLAKLQACGCEHECAVAAILAEKGMLTNCDIEEVLCPYDVRRNPNCAHASFIAYPDPYGPEVRQLIAMRILRKHDWGQWHSAISARIFAVDRKIANNIRKPKGPLMSHQERKEVQQENVAELRTKGELLLRIVDQTENDRLDAQYIAS